MEMQEEEENEEESPVQIKFNQLFANDANYPNGDREMKISVIDNPDDDIELRIPTEAEDTPGSAKKLVKDLS